MKLFEFLKRPQCSLADAVKRQIEAMDAFNREVEAAKKRILNGHHNHDSEITVEVNDGPRNPDA